MRTLFIYFVLSGGLLVVYAFPSYRNHFPNADRVPCYEGAEGCYVDQSDKGDASFCYGVGHSTCQGGTMPLNPFGKAAEHAGAKWTRDLCEADSDGDGQTNGEELGDPCCLWQQDDTPSDYMMLHTPSHPGVAVHFQENYSRPSCSITAPSKKAEALGQFNEWEEQRFVDLVIDNYEIPAKKTTYVEFAFNFPDDSRGMFHVVFAEAIVDQPAYLHHFVIIECSEKWPPELHGKRVSSYGTCNGLQWFWAPGADIVASPQYAGRAIGSDAGVVAFHVLLKEGTPTRALLGLLRKNYGARVDGFRTLQRKHIKLEKTADQSQIALKPQKGWSKNTWEVMTEEVHSALRNAESGITTTRVVQTTPTGGQVIKKFTFRLPPAVESQSLGTILDFVARR